jgi:hypothetical protein
MPFNIRKSSDWTDKEILKYAAGLNEIKSVVLDGTDFASTATVDNSRYFVPAGTILTQSVTNTDKHVAYKGSGKIAGILGRPVDMLAGTTSGSEPAPMFYAHCVFVTSAIVGFTNYASGLVSDLPTCLFEAGPQYD